MAGQNIKHEGFNIERIKREPTENAYAEIWAKQAPTTLGYLLCGQDSYTHNYSQRDATVAATIIQWLGSNVGRAFLAEVQDELKSIKGR